LLGIRTSNQKTDDSDITESRNHSSISN